MIGELYLLAFVSYNFYLQHSFSVFNSAQPLCCMLDKTYSFFLKILHYQDSLLRYNSITHFERYQLSTCICLIQYLHKYYFINTMIPETAFVLYTLNNYLFLDTIFS